MPATIRDVARAAGVHISTVSRTFSAPHLVNPETRTRVLAEAEGLGYRPNRAARALITGRTNNIGLIVADIANPFFPPLIKAAESQARGRDYHVFVADTNEDAGTEEELVHALAKQVDGILLCSPRMNNSLIERLSREVPLVVINRIVAGLPAVVMDVAGGARRAIEHLVGLGHRDIAFVAGPRGSWTNREIRRAATGAARTHGVNLVVLGPSQPTEDAGEAAAEAVARSGMTAVLTYNDLMAVGLLEGLDRLGVRVPMDLSVVGIDDIELSRRIRPKLTTVATPNAAAGRAAVDMLLQPEGFGSARAGRGSNRGAADGSGPWGSQARSSHRASDDDDRRTTAQVTLQTHLIIRDSTGPGPHWPADPGYAASAVSPGAVASYIKE